MAKKETKTNKKENTKNKKSFSKDFKAELKKVVWPTPKQLFNNRFGVGHITFFNSALKSLKKCLFCLFSFLAILFPP